MSNFTRTIQGSKAEFIAHLEARRQERLTEADNDHLSQKSKARILGIAEGIEQTIVDIRDWELPS